MSGRRLTSCAAIMTQLLFISIHSVNSFRQSQGQGQGLERGRGVDTHDLNFDTVEELCLWLCRKHSPSHDNVCPPSCRGFYLNSWTKRSARGTPYDDFNFGFDDYLFLQLLGRNLRDRA